MQRIRSAHLLGGLGIVLTGVLAGCADEQPTGPTKAAVRPALAVAAPAARPDRYLVTFKTTEPSAFAAAVQALGGTVERRHPSIKLAVVSGLGTTGAASLAKKAGISTVQQDLNLQYIVPPSSPQLQDIGAVAASPVGTDQSGAAFFGFQWNMRQVAANQAWGVTPGGAGQLVCVLDTGIDPDHLDMAGKVDLTKIASFISSPLFGGDLDPLDYNSHGTASAGYITSNGIGMASVAPDAKLCAGKVLNVLGSGSFADVIAGIVWATEGAQANVINMSLGGYLDKRIPGAEGLVAALTASWWPPPAIPGRISTRTRPTFSRFRPRSRAWSASGPPPRTSSRISTTSPATRTTAGRPVSSSSPRVAISSRAAISSISC
jgi:subtilisin family serine protease